MRPENIMLCPQTCQNLFNGEMQHHRRVRHAAADVIGLCAALCHVRRR